MTDPEDKWILEYPSKFDPGWHISSGMEKNAHLPLERLISRMSNVLLDPGYRMRNIVTGEIIPWAAVL